VFCVVSRYHGGAFVVFSGTLNDNMEVLAVEGSYASVIGGAPAAAVVFSGDVDRRAAADPRIREAEERIQHADPVEAARLRLHLAALRQAVRAEKLGEVAAEFEAVHDIRRAQGNGRRARHHPGRHLAAPPHQGRRARHRAHVLTLTVQEENP